MIDYSEDWLILLLFQRKGSVSFRACYFAVPASIVALVLRNLNDWGQEFKDDLRGELQLDYSKSSAIWASSTVILFFVVMLRTNRAVSRFWEGTTLLHMMRGEWFDSVSCCISFSHCSVGQKPREVMEFRHTIVRLMSLCHASALRDIANKSMNADTIISLDITGLSNQTLQHLHSMKEDYEFGWVELLLHMTRILIVTAYDSGVIAIEPPILTRVFQTLSRGFVNLLNAKKITDTRFPFPYAQLVGILIFAHVLVTPIILAWVIHNSFWVVVFTFVPIFALHTVNYAAIALEIPFGDMDNDLPLAKFQADMNKCLLMLLEDHADMNAGVSTDRFLKTFATVLKKYQNDLAGPQAQNRVSQFVQEEPTRATRARASISASLASINFGGIRGSGLRMRGVGTDPSRTSRNVWSAMDNVIIEESGGYERDSMSSMPSGGNGVASAAGSDWVRTKSFSPRQRNSWDNGQPKLPVIAAPPASQGQSSSSHWRPPPELAMRATSRETTTSQPKNEQEPAEWEEADWEEPRPAPRSSSSLALVPQGPAGLARLENVVGGSVAAVQTTLERWTQAADDHSQAVRCNTEAINRLCEIIPSLPKPGAPNVVAVQRRWRNPEAIYRLCECDMMTLSWSREPNQANPVVPREPPLQQTLHSAIAGSSREGDDTRIPNAAALHLVNLNSASPSTGGATLEPAPQTPRTEPEIRPGAAMARNL